MSNPSPVAAEAEVEADLCNELNDSDSYEFTKLMLEEIHLEELWPIFWENAIRVSS